MKLKKSPKKWLGQNFLREVKILRKIAEVAQISKDDAVLEVGPGEGSLTEFLLEKAKKVIAVEKDRELVKFLKEKFRDQITDNRLQIIEGDILKINPPAGGENYILVGNIPYYITGEIFRKFLESDNKPSSITFVVQKEVAERIMARDAKESVLSISIKAFGRPELGGMIKAGSFVPKPKMNSAIISVRNIEDKKLNLNMVKKGFAHKRKLLIKNLGATEEIFRRCGISEKARAENLKVEDWLRLARNLV